MNNLFFKNSFALLIAAVLAVSVFFVVTPAFAATRTSTATGGAWATGGTWVGGTAPATSDTVIIATTGAGAVSIAAGLTQTAAGSVTVNNGATLTNSGGTVTFGALTINNGGTVTMYRPLTVRGATNITGTINFGSNNSTVRNMTFTGAVTLNSGAVWDETTTGAAATFSFGNSFTNNSTTFTAQNTAHNFTGSSMTIDGTTANVIPTVTFTGNYSNNGTLTVSTLLTVAGSGTVRLTNNGTITAGTALSGSDGITQGAAGILNIGGTSTITTLTATSTGNIVNYTGAAGQTVKDIAYSNLILSGSGAKSMLASTSVTGNLSIAPTGTTTASIATDKNLTVNSLTLSGLGRINGTWGSTGSTATNKNDTYFAVTTGKLTVTTDTRSTQATLTAVATPSIVVYGSTSTLSATGGSGTGAVTYSVGASTGCSVVGSILSVTDVSGTCDITAAKAADTSYNSATSTAVSITINPKPITVTADAGQTKVYGEIDPAFAYTSSDLVATFAGALDRAAGNNAGTYAIGLGTLTVGANYTITFVPANFSIIAKPITVTADLGQTKVYGASDSAFTYTSDPLEIGDSFTGSLDRVAGENVGSYAITQGNLALSDNYTLTYIPTNLTITKKVASVMPDAKSKVYGEADPELTGALSGFLPTDDVTAIYNRATGANVGSYTISADLNPPSPSVIDNYEITYSTSSFAITPAILSVTAIGNNKIYDGMTDATADFLIADIIGSDDVTANGISTFADKNVGDGKPVNITGITLGGADAGNYTSNTIAETTANIIKRAITVTAVPDTKVYDGSTTSSGTPNITSGDLAGSDTATWIQTFDTKDVGMEKTLTPAGSVNDGNGGDNYTVTFTDDTTGVITVKNITVTADSGQAKVYGDTDPAFTYTSDPLEIGDSFTGSLDRVAGENVGTYAITQGTLTAGGKYNIVFISRNLTINLRAVEITAEAKNKTYGEVDPALTYHISSGSLANGDAFTGSLTRDPGNDFGTYAITQGDLALSDNYTLTYEGANLTIVKATLTITWANPTDITYPTALSDTELNAVSSVAGTLTYTPSVGTVLNAGNHQALEVDFVPDDTTNYNNASSTVFINVLKADPIVTWATPADIAAGTALDATQLNAIADTDGTYTYTPSAGTQLTTVGSHPLAVHFVPNNAVDYNEADATVNVNVYPAPITRILLTASPMSLAFDQASLITVTGKDQYNNTVTNNNSTAIVLSTDGGGNLDNTILILTNGNATADLSKDSVGIVHVTASSDGLTSEQVTVTFTEADTSSPYAQSHTPVNEAADVALNIHPVLVFSEPLDTTTVSSDNIQLRKYNDDSVVPVSVSPAEGDRQVIITPTNPLDFSTSYYFVVSAGVTDKVGNPALVLNGDVKSDHMFTTLADNTTYGVTQPVTAVKTYATADDTWENGWEWVFNVTVPMAETQLQMKFNDWTGSTGSIPATNNIRYYSAQANSDIATITETGVYAGALNLTGDLDVTAFGRQIQITVEAKVPVGSTGGSYSNSYGIRTLGQLE